MKYSSQIISSPPALTLTKKGEEIPVSEFLGGISIFDDVTKKGDLSYSKQHWHSSLQINIVMSGVLTMQVEGEIFEILPGDGILINSNVLHCLNPNGMSDCEAHSFDIYPYAICSEKDINLYNKYITPVINNPQFSHLILSRDVDWQSQILYIFHQAYRDASEEAFAWELKLRNAVCLAWIILLKHYASFTVQELDPAKAAGMQRVKTMITFIKENYKKKLMLGEIAASANISISECSRCFQKYLQQPPMEYVKQVRVIEACRLLSDPAARIQGVAEEIGFSDVPYFYRVFTKVMGCTPKEYRESVMVAAESEDKE